MGKNHILSLFFLAAFSTFVQSQDKAHTTPSIDHQTYMAFDSAFMDKLIAENPSLSHRWKLEPGLFWHSDFLAPPKKTNVDFSTSVYNMDSYHLYMDDNARDLKLKQAPRNRNDLEGKVVGRFISPPE